jgi:hypothetical protein
MLHLGGRCAAALVNSDEKKYTKRNIKQKNKRIDVMQEVKNCSLLEITWDCLVEWMRRKKQRFECEYGPDLIKAFIYQYTENSKNIFLAFGDRRCP